LFPATLRHPPRSTPFPSTTLFRSINREGKIGGRDELGVAHRPRPASGHPDRRNVARLDDLQRREELAFEEVAPPPVIGERRQRLDRKSTRLNSSHVKISYAVFCLK